MTPEIHTERFVLKGFQPEDQAFVFQGLSHPQVIPFYGVRYKSFEETAAQMEFYKRLEDEKTGCWWKIINKADGISVGACGMNAYNSVHERAEMGYWLIPEFWGKGIMSEVLPVMIDYLFGNWKLHRLEAVIEEGNQSSESLSKKLGFTFEGILRESEIKDGKRISLLMYSLLAPERR